jgi:uncharacterized protein
MANHPLKQRISDAMKDAMRAHDKPRLSTIRLILADLKRVEVDERVDLEDDRVIAILDKMVKQRRESVRQFEAAGRDELARQELDEIEVIQEFMPAALDEAEIIALLKQAIIDSAASSMRDMGAVMNIVRPQLTGRADMAQVSQLVKQLLS